MHNFHWLQTAASLGKLFLWEMSLSPITAPAPRWLSGRAHLLWGTGWIIKLILPGFTEEWIWVSNSGSSHVEQTLGSHLHFPLFFSPSEPAQPGVCSQLWALPSCSGALGLPRCGWGAIWGLGVQGGRECCLWLALPSVMAITMSLWPKLKARFLIPAACMNFDLHQVSRSLALNLRLESEERRRSPAGGDPFAHPGTLL